MKKIIFMFMMALMLVSCATIEDKMKMEREYQSVLSNYNQLKTDRETLRGDISNMRNELRALKDGHEPKYIVKFQIKQGTFTLDVFEHMKNEMNAIEIEIPVDKGFYDRLSVGQDITDSFKYGSLIFNGDFSTLHMRVLSKRIE